MTEELAGKDHLIGIFENEYIIRLKNRLKGTEFVEVFTRLVDHSLMSQADLSYDFNTAVNALLTKFPGRDKLYVSEVHQSLRDLGIVDYQPADFAYIEETLKRFGVLVVPDLI